MPLHESEFSILTPVTALINKVSFQDLLSLNFSVFCEVFLRENFVNCAVIPAKPDNFVELRQ
jgi:hypothetical protein